MNFDSIIETINSKLIKNNNCPLNPPEIMILKGIWEYQTYNQIASNNGYSPGYFTNVVAPQLWKRLSPIIGQRVTKKNCRTLIEVYVNTQTATEPFWEKSSVKKDLYAKSDRSPSYPSGPVPSNSIFYIERPPIETSICQEIRKCGALIRIKAPQEMGKTSLLLRTLNYAQDEGYRIVTLNFEQTDRAVLEDLNRFLRWICANISRQLGFESNLDQYWDDDIGSSISCTLYLQEYILEQIENPLILAFDEVNRIFEHPKIAEDFLPLLRSWYEESKKIILWRKLRIIIVHSTEIYVPLRLKQSPFNIGLPIQLNDFTPDQVQNLAQSYGLQWKDGKEVKELMATIGGHPAMVQMSLYHISQGEATLKELMENAATLSGIYAHHLQRHQARLQEEPELALALKKIIDNPESVQLEAIVTYKLMSMGLIKLKNNKVRISYDLYYQYFKHNLYLE